MSQRGIVIPSLLARPALPWDKIRSVNANDTDDISCRSKVKMYRELMGR